MSNYEVKLNKNSTYIKYHVPLRAKHACIKNAHLL